MYAIEHQGKAFTPDGRVDIADVETHNQRLEREQLAELQTHPERAFLYVKHGELSGFSSPCTVTTWPGTQVGQGTLGPRAYVGFDRWTYRRAISVRIFGTLYHGWYMESSGDYCRLKKAKRQ